MPPVTFIELPPEAVPPAPPTVFTEELPPFAVKIPTEFSVTVVFPPLELDEGAPAPQTNDSISPTSRVS